MNKTKARLIRDTNATLVSSGDLVWAHLNNPRNQPVISVLMTFSKDADATRLVSAIKDLEILNRVMVEGHWVPRPKVGRVFVTFKSPEAVLSETLAVGLNIEEDPYSITIGDGFVVLRIHHGLGDGHTLVNALLGLEGAKETQRKRNGRSSSLFRTARGLLEILVHKPEGLGIASGEKEAFILGPWSLSDFKKEASRRNLSLNDAFLRGLERAMERSGFPGVSAGATVEFLGSGNNRFGLILTKLTTLSPVQVAAHGAASMGLISLAGRFGEKAVNALINLLSRRIDLLVSNVRGPAELVAIGGVTIESLGFLVPTVGNVPLGVTLLSYAGEIRLGVSIDKGAKVDTQELRQALVQEFNNLCGAQS